MNKVSKVK